MEALALLLLALLIVLVVALRNGLFERLERLEREIARLREERPLPAPPPVTPTPEAPSAAPCETIKPPIAPAPTPAAAPPLPAPPAPPPPPPDFFDRHPDLEKFIGENLISKIGIAILVLAIGFFVKYAIDNDWIGPVGRVGTGLLCGGILIGIAHRLRNQYKAFSSVLVGGGLAVLYFTIALGYHQYQLFNQPTAFAIMLVITAFSVALSLLYDRQELAIIALVGGFVTPFLVSNGRGDYVVLFSYLLILNCGLLVIAYYKLWRWLNILSFGFTAVLFASWLLALPYDIAAATYRGGWIFGTIFYLVFFVINIAYTVRRNKAFIASDFGILLSNTCLYFAAGLYFISQLGLERYKGIYCAVMGIFHLGATWFLFRKSTVDRNILYLLVALTLSFVSLTAPLQLHGHYITLFWATESVLLYWLFIKSQMPLIRIAAFLLWGAMLVSLGMDWLNIYVSISDRPSFHGQALPVVFNKGCMTGLYVALCCGALFYLRRAGRWATMVLVAGTLVLFITGYLEINHQFVFYYPSIDLWVLYELLYTYLFVFVLSWLGSRVKWADLRWMTAALLTLGVGVYLVSLVEVFSIQQNMLEGKKEGGHFFAHWIGALLVAVILERLITRGRKEKLLVEPVLFTWLICIAIVTFLSAEGQLLVNALFYPSGHGLDELARVYNKTGLPILWGLCSFAFMWLGMRHAFKPLRIVSLALFTLTLLKLFFFDIRNIPIAGKIAAFFCLGVLLLVVSFMYQRLKKIIIEDDEKKPL